LASNAQEPVKESPKFPKAVFGIKGGVNITRFSVSINSESRAKAGLALGIYLKKQIGTNIFFRPELYYSNQGQRDNYLYPYGGPSIGRTTTNMHYINVPFLLEFGGKVSFQAGAQIGLLVAGKEKGIVASVDVDENLRHVMTTADMSVVIGVGISPTEHFNGGIRINYGVSNIYNPDIHSGSITDVPQVQNRVLHFYVAYSF
jgi:hypothetical protein